MQRLILIAAVLLLGTSCARRLPANPLHMVIKANEATCDMLPIADRSSFIGECRFTIETKDKVEFHQIEFRRY